MGGRRLNARISPKRRDIEMMVDRAGRCEIMEHQEMIEVLRSKLYGLKLKRDIWVKSGTVLGMPNFIIDDIKALTQAIAILKRVADVEGVMEISHSACEKCHAFSDRRLCGVKKGVCADSAAEISQYLIKGE